MDAQSKARIDSRIKPRGRRGTPFLRFGRDTLVVGLMVAFLPVVLSAAGAIEEPVETSEEAALFQAPQLAELVTAGELPPLEERIPTDPKVVEPNERIGRYGGTARSVLLGPGDGAWITRSIGYDGLIVWSPDWSEPTPGAAASFQANDDATEFTVRLREGLRWSDGEPFTSADVEWWWENEALHEGLNPSVPSDFVQADVPASLEVIDEVTFRFSFEEPYPLFFDALASTSPWIPTAEHYGRRFHADFNEDIHDIARGEGFDDWIDYYGYMILDGAHHNAELPTIRPWIPLAGEGYTGDTTRVRFGRNPYYYRVDTEGNQLPYIDYWAFDIYEDREVILLQTLAGEIDLLARHIDTVENRPVLYDGKERGDYRFVDRTNAATTQVAIKLNLTHEDEWWRDVARSRDFRIGLSYAINRDEISDIIFAGLVEPRQPAPHDTTPWYHERLATQYLDHDPELAREHFQKAGFSYDNNGRLIGPENKPVEFQIDVLATDSIHIDTMEIIQQQWATVGVRADLNVIDRTLFEERRNANQHQANVWHGSGGMRDGLTDPRNYFPFSHESNFAPRWVAYFDNPIVLGAGVEPESPPEPARTAKQTYDRLLVSPPERHAELMSEILDIAADEFWTIGTVSVPPGYGIVHNRIINMQQEFPGSWSYGDPGATDLSQLFIDE